MSDADDLRAQIAILSGIPGALAAATSDPQTLLQAIATQSARAMDAFCGFMRVSADGRVLEGIARATPPGKSLPEESLSIVDEPVALDGASALARAVREKCAVHVPRVTEENLRARYPDPAQREIIRALATSSLLIVPVIVRGTVLGVLSMFRRGPDAAAFSDDEMRFAGHLADHAALALTNSRLIEEGPASMRAA
jgi:GAF domain-containing protein